MKKLIIILFVVAPLVGLAQVKEFGWLIGKWKIKNKEVYESWKSGTDEKLMEGISYRVKGADTVVTERIKIKFEKDAFFYIPDVAGEQPEVYFRITSFDDKGFTAEDPKHDFPKIIRYKLMSSDAMMAEIEGDGKVIKYEFGRAGF